MFSGTTQAGPDLEEAIRDYVRVYVWRHGRRKTAEDLGVSRHTLWRFLERGHMGRAMPSAVLKSATTFLILRQARMRPFFVSGRLRVYVCGPFAFQALAVADRLSR